MAVGEDGRKKARGQEQERTAQGKGGAMLKRSRPVAGESVGVQPETRETGEE